MKINGERNHERKARLRAEAEARQAARSNRTPEQQLKILGQRMGNSAREKARLEAVIEARDKKPDLPIEVVVESEEPATAGPRARLSAKEVRKLSKKGA